MSDNHTVNMGGGGVIFQNSVITPKVSTPNAPASVNAAYIRTPMSLDINLAGGVYIGILVAVVFILIFIPLFRRR